MKGPLLGIAGDPNLSAAFRKRSGEPNWRSSGLGETNAIGAGRRPDGKWVTGGERIKLELEIAGKCETGSGARSAAAQATPIRVAETAAGGLDVG